MFVVIRGDLPLILPIFAIYIPLFNDDMSTRCSL